MPVAAQPASLVCAGYGLRVSTATYDTCVAYQEFQRPSLSKPVGAADRLDQYNNRIDADGYRVDGTGHRMPVDSLYYRP